MLPYLSSYQKLLHKEVTKCSENQRAHKPDEDMLWVFNVSAAGSTAAAMLLLLLLLLAERIQVPLLTSCRCNCIT